MHHHPSKAGSEFHACVKTYRSSLTLDEAGKSAVIASSALDAAGDAVISAAAGGVNAGNGADGFAAAAACFFSAAALFSAE